MAFQITTQHAAFFSWVEDPAPKHRAAILEAVAGSGKTTTLREAATRIPSTDRVLYLAFNKKTVEEVQGRGMPSHVSATTLNSLGHRCVCREFGNVRLDAKKTSTIIDNLFGKGSAECRKWASTVSKLVGKAKTVGLVPSGIHNAVGIVEDTKAEWDHIIDHFDIAAPYNDDTLMPQAIEHARKVLRIGLLDTNVIDFDDQLYLTVVLGLPMPRFKWVMIDEAQDVSAIQRKMLHGAVADDGRLIAVGDAHQAIYGFRGADSDSLGAIGREFGAQAFPLTVTYRCPTDVVAIAKQFVPHLEAVAGAPAGTVVLAPSLEKHDWLADDLVICRNTAPLITLAYRLLRKRVPCRVLGREIGQGLSALVKQLRPTSVSHLLEKLVSYTKTQTEKLKKAGHEHKLEALHDKVETLRAFALEVRTLPELEEAITSMFSDEVKNVVTLSTIHKAKGSEADRVVILDPHRLPSRMAKQAWEVGQERNLAYVAITRARKTLVLAALDGAGTPIRAF